MLQLYCSHDNQHFCNFIGSTEIPVEFMQSDPKSLELPPPREHILKVITCWEGLVHWTTIGIWEVKGQHGIPHICPPSSFVVL